MAAANHDEVSGIKLSQCVREEEEEFTSLLRWLGAHQEAGMTYLSNTYSVEPERVVRVRSVVPVAESAENPESPKTKDSANSKVTTQVGTNSTTSWVEGLNINFRILGHSWQWHTLLVTRQLLLIIIASVVPALLVPVSVHLLRGGFWGQLLIFSTFNALALTALWRLFAVCGGTWAPWSVPLAMFTISVSLCLVGQALPALLEFLNFVGNIMPLTYIVSLLCHDSSQRPMAAKLWLILGAFLGAVPIYAACIIFSWAYAALANDQVLDILRRRFHLTSLIAVAAWTGLGFFLQKSGELVWRRATRHGARSLKRFEFNVHCEVGLTATGLQLFSGNAILTYVIWAFILQLVNAVQMVPRIRRCCPAGSTPALHVVRLLVDNLARLIGILTGLMVMLLCTLFQLALHPECTSKPDTENLLLAYRAPTLATSGYWAWAFCVGLVLAGLVSLVLAAAKLLKNMERDATLLSAWAEQTDRTSVVDQMAWHAPVSFLLVVAHTCLLRVRKEVVFIVALHIVMMSASWFVMEGAANKDFWEVWTTQSSWFYCS